ncbi:alcohol dehydrogenase catalytic domain-containing protein [Blastococcus sp. URHD0036]|uniref:alcohol dehydrogenase catalytic domain-containing protein n=1 Tax=Blastococcus sp. URHD0036 TaxID=1380356 RepID=UPI000497B2B3|nr:zinc-binding dehydrogenase [Blastococcus sp. URHD0036]
MKAWRITCYGHPLDLRDVPRPSPGQGQVLVDVRAAGLCHTDISEIAGRLTVLNPPLPFTPGHEIAGVVAELGPGATRLHLGQRVALPASGSSPGIASDGGFAEFVVATESDLISIPESVDFSDAAPATDAGMTSMHALRVGGVGKGTRVGVIGLGGLGSMGSQIAVALGAEVYAAELNEDVWERAAGWGVRRCARDITEFAAEELEVIVDFAGAGTTTSAAIEALGHGGRVVQVGSTRHEALISTRTMLFKELSLHGSQGGSRQDALDVIDLIARGAVIPFVTPILFDEIGDGIDRLEGGDVRGRLVALRSPS